MKPTDNDDDTEHDNAPGPASSHPNQSDDEDVIDTTEDQKAKREEAIKKISLCFTAYNTKVLTIASRKGLVKA